MTIIERFIVTVQVKSLKHNGFQTTIVLGWLLPKLYLPIALWYSSSNSGRLTFLKETARSPEWLCVTTGKLYHSLCHWMVFTQIFVSYESVQYKRNMFTFLFNGSLYWKKLKQALTSAYIACATGKWYHSIELIESSLLKYRYWTFAKNTASALWRSFEHPASLLLQILSMLDEKFCQPLSAWLSKNSCWWRLLHRLAIQSRSICGSSG